MKNRHIRGRGLARRPPVNSSPPPKFPPPPYLSIEACWFLLGFLGIIFVLGTTLPLLSPWFSKSDFLGIIQILFLTINICITPTIAAWVSKGKSRIMQSSLEGLLFIGSLIGFSWWMFGLSILGFWVIPSILLILVVEVGSNIIEIYKISTLERLAEELSFENVKDNANEIENLFENELAIYSSVPIGLSLGTILGIIYNQSRFEIVIFGFRIVVILAAITLIYFLCISFERMSDSLFKESDISLPKLQKEHKGLVGLFVKFYRLIVPSSQTFNQEDKDIEIASIVSDLRKIYLYDAIHNGLLLLITAILITQLYEINLENQDLLAITIMIWVFIVIVFNLLPYAIGQASLHNKILKKYKGIKRIEMLEKLHRSSPLLPLISLLYTGSNNESLNLRDFLFNPIWNGNFKKMLNFMEENERQRNKLLKKMVEKPTFDLRGSQIGGGIAGKDYTGDVIHNYAPDRNLAEAAKEIQQLLDQLSETYPANSTNEKIVVATKALEEIEKSKPLVKRILSAFKAGGSSALEQSLSHPAASFLINFIKDWQETKENQTE